MRAWMVVLMAVVGCGRGDRPGSTKTSGAIGDAVPASAGIIVLLGSPIAAADTLIASGLDAREVKALKEELFTFVEKRTGLKVAGAKSVTIFIGDELGGALIDGVSGTLKGASAGAHEGAPLVAISDDPPLVAAQLGGTLVIGNETGVKAALDAAAGRADSLRKVDPKLVALAEREARGALIAVAARPGAISDPTVQAGAKRFGVERGVALLRSGGGRLVLEGDQDKLKSLADLAKAGLSLAVAQAVQQKDAALADGAEVGTAEGLSLILIAHLATHYERVLQPKVAGGRLELDVAMPFEGGSSALMLAGVAAAVAIPAFMTYVKKSKSEAPARAYPEDDLE